MQKLKLLVFLAITALICLSCNLSATKQDSTPDLQLDTVVAATLSAQPTFTKPATQQPSAAIQPTNTKEPSTPTVTITPTVKPETATATSPAGPKANLGSPTWQTNFSDGKSGFYVGSDEYAEISVLNNALVFTATMNVTGWRSWSMQYRKTTNFYLEGKFTVQQCSGADQYGLAFRAPDYTSGYFFGLTCNGKYSLMALTSDFADIIKWTPGADIHAGSNQTNVLGVMVKDNHISLYINDKLAQEVTDDTFDSQGTFGAWIAAYETSGFTYLLDEIAYWDLDNSN